MRKRISQGDRDESGTFFLFSMTSAQARNAMNIIRNGKEDEHPEMYIHYGYKVKLNKQHEY